MRGAVLQVCRDFFVVAAENGSPKIFELGETVFGYWPHPDDDVVWDDTFPWKHPRVRPARWDDLPVASGEVIETWLGDETAIIRSDDGRFIYYTPGNQGWSGIRPQRLWTGDRVVFRVLRDEFAVDVKIEKEVHPRPVWDDPNRQWRMPG